MQITYRKNIAYFLKNKMPSIFKDVDMFLIKKYPHINFENVNLILSYTGRSNGRFTSYKKDKSYHIVFVSICDRLILYDKKTIGLTTPIGGLPVGYDIATASLLIHELTHYVQYIENRKFSEVETTLNEIEFLKEKDMFWYSKLVPSKL